MKPKLFPAIALLAFCLFISCNGKDKKQTDEKNVKTETTTADDNMVPDIDTAALKDEASLLDAMQKVADARIADEKKQKADPNYQGHYLELTKLYTAVLSASTAYSKTLKDAAKALEYDKKFTEIQNRMYAE